MRSFILFALALVAGACLISAQSSSLGHVVGDLSKYQTSQGGFLNSLSDSNPSAQATSDALFLSDLFDLDSKINTAAAATFLNDLHRNDGGYAPSASTAASTIEATHAAVSGLLTLDSHAQFSSVAQFLRSTLNKATGFASSRPGEPTSLEATVAWFELASQLDLVHSEEAQSAIIALKAFLADRDTEEDAIIFFDSNEDSTLSPIAFNALAIRLGEAIGYEFGEESLKKWAQYFNTLQLKSGCYVEGPDSSVANVASSAHATRSLYTLQRLSRNPGSALAKTDLRSFQQCLASTVAPTVSAVAEGHRSLAVSTFFGHYFNLKFGYEVDASRLLREGESLIQGQQILPTVGVSTDFGLNTGLTAQILIDIADAKTTIDLLFEPQANTYRAVKNFDTSSVVGPMTISFILSKHLALIGDVTFARRESKLVGYGIDVTPSAVHTASGRSILAGSVASPGTSFHFPVHLYTLSNPTLTSGPFTVLLKAVDSSGTAIHSASIDGLSAAEGLNFEYVLHRNDLPPGQLTFEFSVEDHGRRGAHTHTSVTYAIETTLAAADIEASSTSLSIGDRLAVSFEPVIVLESAGTLPLGTEGDHEFFLDLTSASGNVVHSVSGTPSGDRVSFSYVIPANPAVFASSLSLVFRYHPASGADTTLVHIDSTGAEAEQLSVAVLTELVLTDAETIPSSSYSYGDDVAWSFTLSDARSGSSIAASNSGRSGIFVSLRHGSGDDSFLSARIYAVASTGTSLAGKFTITANALPGAATVLVEVLDIDGKAVSITGTSSRTVTIVGSIQASISTHSSSLVSAEKAAFIADFSLTHDNKPLPQSELHAIVYQGSELIPSLAHLPVAATPTGYSVSWTLPLDSAVSGQYEVRIVRTQEYRHFIQLLNDYSAASQRVHPITAISLYHSSPVQSYVGVPTEYFAIAIFGFISFKVLTTYALKPKSPKKK